MSDQHANDPQQLKKWIQLARNNDNPNTRRQALLKIQQFDDPRIPQFFKYISESDSDSQVRELAKNLLTQKQSESDSALDSAMSEASLFAEPTSQNLDNVATWTCVHCGEINPLVNGTCSNCNSTPSAKISHGRKVKRHKKSTFGFGNDAFLYHERNRDFLTGKRRNPVRNIRNILILFALVPVMVFSFIVVEFDGIKVIDWLALNNRGIPVQGTYIARDQDGGDGRYGSYVTYEFTLNTQLYSYRQSVPNDIYNTAVIGEPVTITVDPQNPANVRIEGTDSASSFMTTFIMAFCFNMVTLPVIIGIIGYVIYTIVQSRNQVMNGQVIFGKVIDVSKQIDDKNNCHVRISYEFLTPEGHPKIGKVNEVNNNMKNRRVPLLETKVAVLYHNTKNFDLL